MAHELHVLLAAASTVAVLLVAFDALRRVVRGVSPGPRATHLLSVTLLLLVITSASGLGLLAGGGRPGELYHLMYGSFALVSLPLASSLGTHLRARRQSLVMVAGALFALVVIARLFATG